MSRQVVRAMGRSRRQIDFAAFEVVKRYQPEMLADPQPFNVEEFFELELPEFRGITTDYQELSGNIHAYTDIGTRVCVVSKELVETPSQRRFLRSTLSHEVGHCHMHVPEFRARKAMAKFVHEGDHQSLRMYREEQIKLYENPEWQAWRYAGALMMPAQSVLVAAGRGATVLDLCEIFDLNRPFVETRLRALGLAGKIKAF